MTRPFYAKRLQSAPQTPPGEPQPVAPHPSRETAPSCEMRKIMASTDLHLAACHIDGAIRLLTFADWYPGEHVRLLCELKTRTEELQALTKRLDRPPW
jgi:hypothetical protein